MMHKMKNLLCLALLLLMAACLSGCAQKEAKPLQEAVSAALIGMEELVEFPADELGMIADITEDDYTECVYLASRDGVSAREAIVLRAKDEAKVEKLIENLESYLARRQNETRDYLPDEYALLLQAGVERKHMTVALIVGENAKEETKKLMAGE